MVWMTFFLQSDFIVGSGEDPGLSGLPLVTLESESFDCLQHIELCHRHCQLALTAHIAHFCPSLAEYIIIAGANCLISFLLLPVLQFEFHFLNWHSIHLHGLLIG